MKSAPYYSPIMHRPPLAWPDGAHVALWVIPNIEFFSLAEMVLAGSDIDRLVLPGITQLAN